jgi:hypothetical protein
MRRIAMLLAAGITLGLAGTAAAQSTGTGGTTGTTTPTATSLAAADFLIRIEHKTADGKWVWLQNGTTEFARFFTRARCICNEQLYLRIDLSPTGNAKVTSNTQGNVKVLLGPTADCVSSNSGVRGQAGCYLPDGGAVVNLSQMKYAPYRIPIGMKRLFQPRTTLPTDEGCSTVTPQFVYLWVDTTLSGAPDTSLTDMAAPNQQLPVDGQPPPEPTGITVRSGGEALQVAWDQITGVPDFSGGGFVVFCARGGKLPVFADPQYTGAYDSPAIRCPMGAGTDTDGGVLGGDGGVLATDAGATTSALILEDVAALGSPHEENGDLKTTPPPGFVNTDPKFECTPLITTGTSARIEGLENGVDYAVGVAAVDKTGNASPITRVYVQSPVPTRDFYRGYRAAGGKADGGFCTVGGRGSRSLAALGAVAAAVLYWRRRRRAV